MPTPGRTPGIPAPLLKSMRDALSQSVVFFNPMLLWTVYNQEELRPFRGRVPEGFDVDSRVRLTIGFLHERYYHAPDGSYHNALVVLLRAIAAQEEDTALQERLENLADTWQWYLERPEGERERLVAERNPEQVAMLHIGDAQKMLKNARAVAQVSTPRIRKGQFLNQGTGTAWLIAPGLALTAWHVVEARAPEDEEIAWEDIEAQARNTEVKFDFLTAGEGIKYGVSKLEYPRQGRPFLDFAVLRLEDRAQFPLEKWGTLRLDLDAPLTVQTMLYIIQHPLGQEQQGAGDLYAGKVPERPSRILYKTPTEPGTSGAPVFMRDTWRVVALHSGENPRHQLREGILVGSILDDLRSGAPDLYEEIIAAQDYG